VEIALEGLTDDELACKLGISSSSVKKRWLGLLESVAVIRPEIFPDAEDAQNRAKAASAVGLHPHSSRGVSAV
jgi:hypothetical protein